MFPFHFQMFIFNIFFSVSSYLEQVIFITSHRCPHQEQLAQRTFPLMVLNSDIPSLFSISETSKFIDSWLIFLVRSCQQYYITYPCATDKMPEYFVTSFHDPRKNFMRLAKGKLFSP